MISFDGDVFGPRTDDPTFSNESVVVRGSTLDRLLAALHAVAPRFMRVDESGTEHPNAVDLEDLYDLTGGLYTPNYVSDPEIQFDPPGVGLYVDCKGAFDPAVGATFRRILREELIRAGVKEATVHTPLDASERTEPDENA